jgi:hypothetical protein
MHNHGPIVRLTGSRGVAVVVLMQCGPHDLFVRRFISTTQRSVPATAKVTQHHEHTRAFGMVSQMPDRLVWSQSETTPNLAGSEREVGTGVAHRQLDWWQPVLVIQPIHKLSD